MRPLSRLTGFQAIIKSGRPFGLFLVSAVALLAAFALRWPVVVNHDVAWLFIAAGRMIAGGSYSADFFEINMPLAVAIYIPAHALALLPVLSGPDAITIWIDLLATQCLALTIWANRRNPDVLLAGLTQPLGIVWLVVGLVLLPAYDFGQREHLGCLLWLPFLVMIGNDFRPRWAPLRTYVSVLAAIGCFIKPHFAALPFLLLAARGLRDRSWAPLRSPEFACLMVTGMLYAAIVGCCFVEWFLVARWGVDLYQAYALNSWTELFQANSVPAFCVVSAFALLLAWRKPSFRSAAALLLLAAAYGWLVYLLQFKGWRYQFLGAAIPLFLSMPLAWQACRNASSRFPPARIAVALAALLLLVGTAGLVRSAPRTSQLPRSAIGEALAIAEKGDSVYAFTTTVTPVFPTVLLLDLKWGSRYPAMWPLAGLVAAAQGGGPQAQSLDSRYREKYLSTILEDFSRYRPGIVLVDKRSGQFGLPPGYEILSFFSADPRFERMWSGYTKLGEGTDWIIYARAEEP